jgi:hypothetical protein
MPNAAAAVTLPTARVCNAERSRGNPTTCPRSQPTALNAPAVSATLHNSGKVISKSRASSTKGAIGRSPHSRQPARVAAAAVCGEFLDKHEVNSPCVVSRDDVDGTIEIRAREPLGSEQLANFLAFALRDERNVAVLVAFCLLSAIQVRLGSRITAGSHAQAVGHKVGNSQHHDGATGQACPNCPCGNSEGRDRTVDRAEHPIRHIRCR